MDEANVQFRPGVIVTEAYLDKRPYELQKAILEAIYSRPCPGPVPEPKCEMTIGQIETL